MVRIFRIVVLGAIAVFSLNPSWVKAEGGTAGNGGNWFIRPLPILKFTFPESQGVVAGVHYLRVRLSRCTPQELQLHQNQGVRELYLPGKNWEVYRVMTDFGSLRCSFGVAELNPTKALSLLLRGEVESKEIAENGLSLYDKSFGGVLVKGPHLIIPKDEKLRIFSLERTNYKTKSYFLNPPVQAISGDDVYIATGLDKSENIYFGYLANSWSIILPLDVTAAELPLAEVSKIMDDATEKEILPIWKILDPIPHPQVYKDHLGGENWADGWIQKVIWNDHWQTTTAQALRAKLAKRFGYQAQDWALNKDLQDKVQFDLVPTILESDINHPHYHSPGKVQAKITLPLGIPKWRVSADLVHEMVHMLQSPISHEMSDEEILTVEFEAHQAERRHIAELIEQNPVLKVAVPSLNYVVASAIPLGAFGKSPGTDENLCGNILKEYKLNSVKISVDTLSRLKCSVRNRP